ncbi:hypothetical protein L3X38_032459 [Prunus dulcis]|uniref:Integrase catalytic domain-containing protein n=1 Tax=Prunus dulcis TaxID=3755 RepID=A0AAD4VGD3_PRUDU|nr:hypothetical protein L3X38_032459 [Prunus dulcis]
MAKHPRMILYLDKVQELLKAFSTFTIQQGPHAENTHADVQQKAVRYYKHGNKLIRKSYSCLHLTCIKYPQTLEVFCIIHDGECGLQFIGKQITAFFVKYKIKQHLSTPRYPQGNGQAEASNKVILDCLKKRLEGAEGKWVDEIPGVLWAYRTTKRRSTSETPFFLAYGTEAIIPPHIIVPFISLEVGSVDQNSEQMTLNLDLLEGEHEKTIIQVASYQQQLKSYYEKRAKEKEAAKKKEESLQPNILVGKFAPTVTI